MRVILALAVFWITAASAQVTPLPPQHGVRFDIGAPHYAISQIDSALFVRSLVAPGNDNAFQWNMFGVLDNYGDAGENVGLYVKANQYGRGATWGGVFESQCINRGGQNCYGLEIDVAAPVNAEQNGIGVGMYISRASPDAVVRLPSDKDTASATVGYLLGANYYDIGHVSVGVGFDVLNLHCTIACVRIPAGESMAYETGGRVVQKFDPQTGYAGWWRADLGECIWCVNMSNGDIKRMWIP